MSQHPQDLSRRQFLTRSAAGIGTVTLTWQASRALAGAGEQKPVRFGLVADVHKDVMHDADERLALFVQEMQKERPDFVIQIGDFCVPTPANDSFMDIWRQLDMPRHNVLGNHDTDGDGKIRPDEVYAYTPEETMEYWGMPARYYSFDLGGLHFVILDGNEEGPGQQPYYRYVAEDQAQWLRKDLKESDLPTIVFIHQSLERENGGIENQAEIRAIFESANRAASEQKVIACFTGHHHRDYVRKIGGIYYPQINSMSYHWLGGDYLQTRYTEEIDQQYPYIKYTIPYKDPLFALVEVDSVAGKITIQGRQSEFVGPSPWDQGADKQKMEAASLVPGISNRLMTV